MKSALHRRIRIAVILGTALVLCFVAPGCRGRGAGADAYCPQPDVPPPPPPLECADSGASACLCPDFGVDLLALSAGDADLFDVSFAPGVIPSTDAAGAPDGGPVDGAAAPIAPRLGYVIVYVPDVVRSLAFYERAFGLTRGFVSEAADYAELSTGETRLAFVSEALAHGNLPGGFRANAPGEPPAGFEVALVTPDVDGAYRRALEAGATKVAEPARKPWGQTVAYVRDPDGVLVELATPMETPPPTD
jgi:catechol 2,3-dioxygenase-like lactoylglutathione lyase family enzyme